MSGTVTSARSQVGQIRPVPAGRRARLRQHEHTGSSSTAPSSRTTRRVSSGGRGSCGGLPVGAGPSEVAKGEGVGDDEPAGDAEGGGAEDQGDGGPEVEQAHKIILSGLEILDRLILLRACLPAFEPPAQPEQDEPDAEPGPRRDEPGRHSSGT